MYLLANDTVHGARGRVMVDWNGEMREACCFKNIRTTATIQSQEMKCVGTNLVQDKPDGYKPGGKANVYYGSDRGLWRDMVLEYINPGAMPEFNIQITNQDPSTTLGTEVTAYYGCHLTGEVPLSILDSEEAMLNYDFNFVYTRVQRLQDFNAPERYGS